jgi:hypothetical protein
MTNWRPALGLSVALALAATISSAVAQQLNPEQIQIIRDTAASICNTVKEAKGQKSDVQIQGDVKAQLSGLVGKLVDAGASGKGSLNREEFEGLSRDATATALEGDRVCRERLFNKMFDKATSSDKKSALPKAEKLIAAVDLGYHLQDVFVQLDLGEKEVETAWKNTECPFTCLFPGVMTRLVVDTSLNTFEGTSAKVNADATRLNIEPYNFHQFHSKLWQDVHSIAREKRFGLISREEVERISNIYREAAERISKYFRSHITEQDTLEAYKLGADVSMLMKDELYMPECKQPSFTCKLNSVYKIATGHGEGPIMFGFPGFVEIREDLTRRLRSLNLAELDNQIQKQPERRSGPWLYNFMAFVDELIRKNYPTVSLAQ